MSTFIKFRFVFIIIFLPVFTMNAQQENYKFRDTSLRFDERVEDLLARLTLEEQGLFILGSSHQKQARYTKKTDSEKEN